MVTARRVEGLEELTKELAATRKIRTEVFVADLGCAGAERKIFTFTQDKGIDVELLINNAGFGAYGEFTTVETHRLLDMVQVNCSAVVHLTRLYLPEMIN